MPQPTDRRFIPSFLFFSAAAAASVPYLPILLRDLGYGPIRVGTLMGIFQGAGVLGPFLFGYWADRVGNYRPALLVAAALPAAVAFPLALLANPVLSALCLVLLAFGIRSAASLLDSVTTIRIGSSGNYGRIRVWGSVGFIMVALFLQVTPLLRPAGAPNIGIWIAVFALASVVPVLRLPAAFLASSGDSPVRPVAGTGPSKKTGRASVPVLSAYVLGGLAMAFVNSFSMAALYGYFPLYLTEVLRWDVVGLSFAIGTASELPVIFLSSLLIYRFGPLPLLAVSTLGVAARLAIWAFLPFKPLLLASHLLHALCFGTFFPAFVHFAAGIFPPESRGRGMSLFVAAGIGLPSLLGTFVGGIVLEGRPGAAGFGLLFALYSGIAALGPLVYGAMRLRGKAGPAGK